MIHCNYKCAPFRCNVLTDLVNIVSNGMLPTLIKSKHVNILFCQYENEYIWYAHYRLCLYYISLQWLANTTHIRSPHPCFLWQTHHDDVIKWNHFPRYWPFVRRIHRSLVSTSKRQHHIKIHQWYLDQLGCHFTVDNITDKCLICID